MSNCNFERHPSLPARSFQLKWYWEDFESSSLAALWTFSYIQFSVPFNVLPVTPNREALRPETLHLADRRLLDEILDYKRKDLVDGSQVSYLAIQVPSKCWRRINADSQAGYQNKWQFFEIADVRSPTNLVRRTRHFQHLQPLSALFIPFSSFSLHAIMEPSYIVANSSEVEDNIQPILD